MFLQTNKQSNDKMVHKFRSAMQTSALLSDFLFALKNRNIKIIKIKDKRDLRDHYWKWGEFPVKERLDDGTVKYLSYHMGKDLIHFFESSDIMPV